MQGRAEATKRNRRGELVVNKLSSTLNHHLSYTLATPPVELAVANYVCTSHLFPATFLCDNKVAVLHGGKRVGMPNGETMVETRTSLIPFPQPLLAARKCDVFPEIQQPLLYIGQLCDAVFTATLDSETFQLAKDGSVTLSGTRYRNNGLYFIPLQGYPTSTTSPLLKTPEISALTSAAHTAPQAYVFANSAYHMNMLPALVQFLHRACFSPVVDTWCKAIDAGYLTTWPCLSSNLVCKHLPTSI